MSLPSESSVASGRRRLRVRVTGTVQGVGFRPYVFRLASGLGLAGYVLNDERGVLLEVEGAGAGVERFLARLPGEAPPLATVERVDAEEGVALGERGFRIVESPNRREPEALVPADAATCPACLAEVLDPGDRRYRYPFINCTDCGPRFTIVRGVPYDRALTTMVSFEMCRQCRAEYEDPASRRFHAQPIACPSCGPRVRITDSRNRDLPIGGHLDPIEAAAARLSSGRIVAVKGLGGFHLACRADDEEAVATLRSRKHREDRPFALMAPDLGAAAELVELTSSEEELLQGRERPIVIARRHPGGKVAGGVAPRSPDLGVMLPYSPLHHLLLGDAGKTLVMTSGNISDEPIAYRDPDALSRLGEIADFFLIGDRPIHARTDDSVVRSLYSGLRSTPLLLRRSRGYVPKSISLAPPAPRPLLACGAEQKNAFCLAKGGRAWVGPHVGDLKNVETLDSFTEGIAHFQRLFAVEPELVVHDLHPDYLSTRYALAREGVEHLGVQHHHAHLAAVLAEHGEDAPAVGAIYDGTGYGPDGTVWEASCSPAGWAATGGSGCCFPCGCPGARPRYASPGGWPAPGSRRRSGRSGPRCPRRSPEGCSRRRGRWSATSLAVASTHRRPAASGGSSTLWPHSAASGPASTTKGRRPPNSRDSRIRQCGGSMSFR